MKNSMSIFAVIFAQIALLGGSAFAGDHQIVATLQGHGKGFSRVTLHDNGFLTVEGGEPSVAISRKLGEQTAEKLVGLATQVANADVVTVYNEVVCMTFVMVPSADLSVAGLNQDTYRFEGAPRLLSTGRGCSFHKMTYPVQARDQENTEMLKEMLEILALDAIESR